MNEEDKQLNSQIRDMTVKINAIHDSLVGSELAPNGVIKRLEDIDSRLKIAEKFIHAVKVALKIFITVGSYIGITQLIEYLKKQ